MCLIVGGLSPCSCCGFDQHGHGAQAVDTGEDPFVIRAVEGSKPLLHLDTHTNPECGVGVNIQLALKDYYDDVQAAAETKMSQISLQDIIDSYRQRVEG